MSIEELAKITPVEPNFFSLRRNSYTFICYHQMLRWGGDKYINGLESLRLKTFVRSFEEYRMVQCGRR